VKFLLTLMLSGSAFAATTVSGTLCGGQNATVLMSRYSATGVLLSQSPISVYTAGVFSASMQPSLDGSRYEATVVCTGGTSTRQYWLIPDTASATIAQVTVASPDISPLKGYYWDALNLVWASGAGGIQGSGGGGGGTIASTTSVLKGSGTGNAVAATADTDYLTPTTAASTYEAKNANIQAHISSTSNPHSTTAAQVGALPTSTVLAANTTATSNQFFTAYNSTTGAFTKAQPTFANLSGAPTITQVNGAFTGTCDSTTYHRGDGQCTAVTGGTHTQNTDTGTTATSYQIDSGGSGPRISNNAGTMEIRNAANSALAPLSVSQLNVGTGAVAGQTIMKEVSANGTDYGGFTVQDAITTAFLHRLPNATPNNQLLVWATPSGGYSEGTYVAPPANTSATTNQFFTAYSSTTGAFTAAQPSFTNLSGSVAATQMPALTGDVTTSAGAVATTLATKFRTRTCTYNIPDPVATDSGKFKCQVPVASTITYVSCQTDAGSVATVNINKRASSTSNTSGTDAMSSSLTCSSTLSTGTITSSAITARDWLTVTMGTVTSAPAILSISVEYTVN
jgi:hypothetical protein